MENWLIALAIYFGLREAASVIACALSLFPLAYVNTLPKETRDAIQKDWDQIAGGEDEEDEEAS